MEHTLDKEERKRKLDEIIKRKHEVELKKKHLPEAGNKEVFRYEELIRDKGRKGTTKDRVLNNAFCVEIKEDQERVFNIIKEPLAKPDPTWYEQVLEKERKMKRDEMRVTQDRLKMIDKRTRYADIKREVPCPPSKARNVPESVPLLRSSSKKEACHDEKARGKSPEFPQKSDPVFVRRLQPRSLSRKELSPNCFTGRSPSHRKTLGPVQPD